MCIVIVENVRNFHVIKCIKSILDHLRLNRIRNEFCFVYIIQFIGNRHAQTPKGQFPSLSCSKTFSDEML